MTRIEKAMQARRTAINLLKASAIIFGLNILVILWFYVSPNLSPITVRADDSYEAAYVDAKMSPFTEVVDTHPIRRPVKTAEKLRPVLYQPPETSSDSYQDSYQQSLSDAAQVADPAQHDGVQPLRAVQVSAPENDIH